MRDGIRIVASEMSGRWRAFLTRHAGGAWVSWCPSGGCRACPVGDRGYCASTFASKQELALFVSVGGDDVWEADFRDDTDAWVRMRILA